MEEGDGKQGKWGKEVEEVREKVGRRRAEVGEGRSEGKEVWGEERGGTGRRGKKRVTGVGGGEGHRK